MDDIFNEQLIKKFPTTMDAVKKAGIVVIVVILSFLALTFIPSIAPIVILGLAFGAYYLFTFMNLEYEYIFTNGELDVDVIYAKSRRKRLFSGEIKECEIMAHVEDKDHIREFDGVVETKDYSSGKVSDHSYAFIYTYKGKRTKFIIEPNDMLIKAFQRYMTPRKFFVKR